MNEAIEISYKDLKKGIKRCKTEKEKVIFISQHFSNHIMSYPLDELYVIYLKAYGYCKKTKWEKASAVYLNMLGCLEIGRENYKEALSFFKQALTVSIVNDTITLKCAIIMNKSEVDFLLGKYDQVIDDNIGIIDALKEYKKEENFLQAKRGLNDSLTRIGNAYKWIGYHEKGRLYFNEALLVAKKHNLESRVIGALINISASYIIEKDYVTAKKFCLKGIRLAEKETKRFEVQLCGLYSNYIKLLYRTENYRKIKEVFTKYKSISHKKTNEKVTELAITGIYYYSIKEFNKAKEYTLKAIEQNKTSKIEYKFSDLYEFLYNISKQSEKYIEALHYHEEYFKYSAMSKNLLLSAKANFIQKRYEHEKYQNKINNLEHNILKKQSEIDRLAQLHESELLNTELTSKLKEREKIAQNIHDNLGAYLTVSKLQIEAIKSNENIDADIEENINKAIEAIDKAYNEVRSVSL